MTVAITNIILSSAPYIAGIASALIAFMAYREGKRKNKHDELEDMNDRLRADNDQLRCDNEHLRKENNHEN